jgi:hypothetical protein
MVYFDTSLDNSQHSSITVDAAPRKLEEEEPILRQSACPCVRFSLEDNLVVIIPHHTDFTAEEKDAAFYTGQDFSEMKHELRVVARWLVNNNCDTTGEADFSIRGMESKVYDQVSRTKKHSRRLAAAAVFMEQEMQVSEANIDHDAIAEEYSLITDSSQQRAHLRGVSDAVEAPR